MRDAARCGDDIDSISFDDWLRGTTTREYARGDGSARVRLASSRVDIEPLASTESRELARPPRSRRRRSTSDIVLTTIRGVECGSGGVVERNGSARVEPTGVDMAAAQERERGLDARTSRRFRLADVPGCGCFGRFRGADDVDVIAPVPFVQDARGFAKSMSKSIEREPNDRSVSKASLQAQRSGEIGRSMMELYRDIERVPSNALERVDDGSIFEAYPESTESESSVGVDEGDERPETTRIVALDWDRLVSRESSAESPDSALTRANECPRASARVSRSRSEASSVPDERHTSTRASATRHGES